MAYLDATTRLGPGGGPRRAYTGFTAREPSAGGDKKIGGISAGLYGAKGAVIRLGRIGKP